MSFEKPIIFLREGIGNINYGEPPGSGGGGSGTVTGADDGLTDVGNIVKLGQSIALAGDPAKLLESREIPFNGNNLVYRLQEAAGSRASIDFTPSGQAMFIINPGTISQLQQPEQILTIQGQLIGPNTFGNWQQNWIDQGFTNPDGQIDAVFSSGYNIDGGNGRLNALEASFGTYLETHFQQGGIGNGTFEWYLTTDSRTGVINRHTFLVVDKITGHSTWDWHIDEMSWFENSGTGGAIYAAMAGPVFSLIPSAGIQGRFGIFSLSAATDGSMSIQTIPGSGGITQFVDQSGSLTGFFQMAASVQFFTSNFFDGLANWGFQSSAGVGRSRNTQWTNSNLNANAAIFSVWNDGTITNRDNAFFGDEGAGTFPTARVHIGPNDGLGGAGTGPLKFFAPTGLLPVVEAGLVEVDPVLNLYYSPAAVRQSVFVGNDGAAAPALSAGPVFTNFFGGNGNALGDPDSWAQVNIVAAGGALTTYKIPLYL